MANSNLPYTGLGIELIRKLTSEGERIFTTARAQALAQEVGLSSGYLRQALHYLAKSGWLVRLHKGLYAMSPSLPGVAPPHEFEVAMALVGPAAISHWSALHYHNLTEQIPRTVFVLTTADASVPRARGSKAREQDGYPVGDALFRFVQVKPERYFGVRQVWVNEARVTVTDPERTLLDGLTMPQYLGDFSEVLHAFEVRGDELDLERITEYALRLDAATAKRLGWILEHQGVGQDRLGPLAEVEVKGYRTLDPSGPRRGPCNRHWMIQENLPGKVRR